MEDAQIVLERHEQRIRSIERDISDLKAVQAEIRTMNETLVTLAKEIDDRYSHRTLRFFPLLVYTQCTETLQRFAIGWLIAEGPRYS